MKLFLRSQPTAEGLFLLDRNFKKRLVKVMRLKKGDPLLVFSPGKQWECVLIEIQPDGAILRIIREIPVAAEQKLHLVLAQAIPKGDRFDWLLQKATELGVAEIVPLLTERSVVRPSNVDAKLQRWNEIAEHAAGQSENPFVPSIHPPLPLPLFIEQFREGLKFYLHERESSRPLRDVLKSGDSNHIVSAVGPEGGWSPSEVLMLQQAGFLCVHFGPRILRSETAGLALAAVLQYERGDF